MIRRRCHGVRSRDSQERSIIVSERVRKGPEVLVSPSRGTGSRRFREGQPVGVDVDGYLLGGNPLRVDPISTPPVHSLSLTGRD